MTVAPSWIEAHCVIPDGFRRGAPFRLYDYQLEYFAGFYLVRGSAEFDAENPVLAPAFRYRRGLLVGPQKLGKGPHTAAHVCLEGAGPALFAGWAGSDDGYACRDHGCGCGWEFPYEPGEPMGMPWPTPLIQITALSEEQTENIYDAFRPMVDYGPLADLIPKTGEEFTRLPGGGRIDTVTSSAQSRLGQRVTFVPQDEVGLWTKQNKMTKVADTQYRGLAGMGGRASLTTNAWDPSEQSVAKQEFDSGAADVLRQMVVPPKNLRFTNQQDRRKIMRLVYPRDTWRQNGGHVDLDAVEAEAMDMAKRDPAQAERFFGNILAAGAGRAVDPDVYVKLPRRPAPADGSVIGLGFDGSVSGDATVLRGCTPDAFRFTVGVWVRPEGTRGRDWRVPRSEVHAAVAEAFRRWRVGRMFCDPPKWHTEIESWANLYGDEVVLAFDTNQDRRMGAAIDRWRTGFAERAGGHDGDPVVSEHVLNAHLRKTRALAEDEDGRTMYRLVKGDDGGKIDGAVADVLALEAAMTMPEVEPVVDPLSQIF